MRRSIAPSQVSGWGFLWRAVVTYLPTVLVAIYFGIFAADRYVSVATFVVRSPSIGYVSELANIMQGTKVVSSPEDTYVVHEYINSRDAMRALIVDAGLIEAFGRSGSDFFWCYPSLFKRGNEERLFEHYLRFVDVSLDKTTGVSTLRVQGFDPRDAQRIATTLLKNSEALINRLSDRAQSNSLATASKQVDEARARAFVAQEHITAFRIRESVIDPTSFSNAVVVETVARLSLEIAQLNAQISELMTNARSSPQVGSLKTRLAAYEDQLFKERRQLGPDSSSYAKMIDEYERLTLEREFADRLLQSALSSLEVARVEASRQRLFLETIAAPHSSDYPIYPWRWLWPLVVLGVCVVLRWALRPLLADTASHAGK